MAIALDAKTLCECGNQAKYRKPPARSPQIGKLLDAVLIARGGSLQPGDCLVAPDGFKGSDWEEKVGKAAPGLRNTKQFAIYTQDSVEARMDRNRTQTGLDLVEAVHFYTTEPLDLKFQARKIVPKQSTRANFIGPLAFPAYTEMDKVWSIRQGEKKGLYSQSNLPLPGGKCPIEHNKETTRIKSWEIVPAFYHEGPEALATELAHAVGAKAIIDLTPGSGHWAMYAIRNRIPYIGLVFTDQHSRMLHQKLVSDSLKAMMVSNDEMYDSGMATLMKDNIPAGGADTPGSSGSNGGEKTKPGAGPSNGRDELLARIEALRKKSQGEETAKGQASTGAAAVPPEEKAKDQDLEIPEFD